MLSYQRGQQFTLNIDMGFKINDREGGGSAFELSTVKIRINLQYRASCGLRILMTQSFDRRRRV